MNYAYIRYSTEKQDELEQVNAIEDYCRIKGIHIDGVETDRGVSGKVSYKDRRVYTLIGEMQPGDTLIVSEMSRLGRSMLDVHDLILKELKPRGLRLIVIKSSLDLNCSDIKAIDEMILMALSFAAQMERELTSERTREALAARRKAGKQVGGTNDLWGKNTGTDRKAHIKKMVSKSVEKRMKRARRSKANTQFQDQLDLWQARHGKIGVESDIKGFCAMLNEKGITTPRGLVYTPQRARAVMEKLLKF